MRELDINTVRQAVARMVVEANCDIGEAMLACLAECQTREERPLARSILGKLVDNDTLARVRQVPMCQDTGMAVFRVQMGSELVFTGGSLEEAIQQGMTDGYRDGYLRKSVVADPVFRRVNTGDNSPAIIYYEWVDGDRLTITFSPKGFGSENMSAVSMLKPADGAEGVRRFVLDTIRRAGPNPCPPMVVGVGIGGTFEKCAQLAKFALMRDLGTVNPDPDYAALERELLAAANGLDIGPAGLGGKTTALAVHIETFPTHIAGLPVAVNICCHAYRHSRVVL
ncbi:MAG: fumarate hydratase [Ruminococcaceae bacterium]|nr:fumarate hydratase [Oscillospiraceae bacterium]